MSLEKFIKETGLDSSQEIIFYGGSFNPWHEGHSTCLKLLPRNKSVIVIPDHNPFKELRQNDQNFTSLRQINSAIEKINPKFKVFEDFYLKKEKNPTSNWIKELKIVFPNKELSLLMGFDSFISIDRWINAEALLENLSKLYVVDRLNEETILVQQMKRLSKYKNLEIIFLGKHQYEDLSSSQIRGKKS